MNKLLINYIKNYLNEAPIPYPGKYISAQTQHKISPNIRRDMTNLSDEDVLKTLMQNIGERTCISFINKYNENIPSFNINPRAAYETPHGNYAYPLTLENLREIITTKKVKGASFAIDRPYFLLFKVNSPNALIINKDGKTNYKSIRSARRSMSRGKTITLDQDINTVIRNFIYFARTLSTVTKLEWSDVDSNIYYKQQPLAYSKLEDKFEELLNKNIDTKQFAISFGTGLRDFLTKKSSLSLKNKVPSNIEKHFFDETFNLLKKYLVELSNSDTNKFYKGEEETEDFHKIYFICWLLSQVGKISNRKKSNGPILTLLLRSIGLDAIIDQGSSTLHHAEPEQTVSLSFGNIKAANIDFLGTFNNIFSKDPHYIEELAAKIYEEEGYSYDTDFFSENENPISDISGSTVYTYLEDLLLSYHSEDLILNHGVTVEGGQLKVKFDLYTDFFVYDYELTQVQEFIKLMYNAILKSPHKNKIEIDLGLSLFDYDAKVDISSAIKKLFKTQYFELLIKDFGGLRIKLDDSSGVFDSENESFLTYDQELVNLLKPSYIEIILNQGCGITIVIKDRFYLDSILNPVGNCCIFINTSAPITFDLTDMKLFRLKKMEKIADYEQEKQKIIQKINEKYPKVKVKI